MGISGRWRLMIWGWGCSRLSRRRIVLRVRGRTWGGLRPRRRRSWRPSIRESWGSLSISLVVRKRIFWSRLRSLLKGRVNLWTRYRMLWKLCRRLRRLIRGLRRTTSKKWSQEKRPLWVLRRRRGISGSREGYSISRSKLSRIQSQSCCR